MGRSPRFKCAGLVPTWTVDDAIAEVGRIAEAGLGAVMIPTVATPDWNTATGENARRVSQAANVSLLSERPAVANAEKGHWHARDFE